MKFSPRKIIENNLICAKDENLYFVDKNRIDKEDLKNIKDIVLMDFLEMLINSTFILKSVATH